MNLSTIYKQLLKESTPKSFWDLTYEDITNNRDDLNDFTKREAFAKYKKEISPYVNTYNMSIWRATYEESDYIDKLRDGDVRLGIYWSYEKDGAYAYWGDKSKPISVVIGATVDLENVDWVTTFFVKLHGDSDNREREIRLFNNVDIQLTEVFTSSDFNTEDGQPVDINTFSTLYFRTR